MSTLRYLLIGLALSLTASAQTVVVTTSVLHDIATQVAGGSIDLVLLVPNDANPMEYEPTDADLIKVADAGAVISNGAGLEPWLDELLEKAKFTGAHIVATEDVALLDVTGSPLGKNPAPVMGADEPDPYAWHDPRIVQIYVENMRSALSTLFPTKVAALRDNANAYKAQLDSLHEYAIKTLANIAPANRRLVTSLDNFNYFAAAYGFTVVRVPGLASGQPLRPAVLDRLLTIIAPHRPKAVFFERTAHRAALNDIGGGLGTKVDASLYGVRLGDERTPGASYLGMFRWNVDAIAAALSDPPAATDPKAPAERTAAPASVKK